MIKKLNPRKILILPDNILRQPSKDISRVSDETRSIFDDLLETMKLANGIGLAAPQVGLLQKLVVIDFQYSTRYPQEDLATADADLQTQGQEDEPVEDDPIADDDEKTHTLFLANPEVVELSDETNIYQEGCLSIPKVFANVTRPKKVKVRYWDYDGKEQEIAADGLLATCLQHEIDHLNGKLFIDYLSPLKRSIIVRRFTKAAKNAAKAEENS